MALYGRYKTIDGVKVCMEVREFADTDEIATKYHPDMAATWLVDTNGIVQQGWVYNDVNSQWETVPVEAPDLQSELARYRHGVEVGGIEVANIPIQTDRESRANLMAARIMAKEDSGYTIQWKTPNGFVELSAVELIGLADAVRVHVEKCYQAEATVVEGIATDTYTTVSQVRDAFDTELAAL